MRTPSDVLRKAMTPITANERQWIEFIRLASFDTDPPPTLERVQQLQRIFADINVCLTRGGDGVHGG